ncbi:MAG: spermidine synthase, partial [Woeseiaceae bacterium]
GKPDAAIQFDPARPQTVDETTMVIAGTLPLAYMPAATRVANIGMGSGLTTHALLAHSGIEKVDTIEIEPAIVTAASGFGDFVARAFDDPRSEIHIEDAKTYFSLNQSVYDIIIAEPSNPWVSGVSSLFSTEFYKTVKRHLEADGLFVQWLQLYEFDDQLAASILKALSSNFSDFVIYTTDNSNIIVIAKNEGALASPDWAVLFEGGMADTLASVNVNSESDLLVRKLVERKSLVDYLDIAAVPTNSDYYPFVDLNAGKARFLGSEAGLLVSLSVAPIPLIEMLADDTLSHRQLGYDQALWRVEMSETARDVHARLVDGEPRAVLSSENPAPEPDLVTKLMQLSFESCALVENPARWLSMTNDVMSITLPFLDADHGIEIVSAVAPTGCIAQQEVRSTMWLDVYRAVARRDASTMSSSARLVLATETEISPALRKYLLSTAMLGDVASGKPEDALVAWNEYAEEAFASGGDLPTFMHLITATALQSGSGTSKHANAGSP